MRTRELPDSFGSGSNGVETFYRAPFIYKIWKLSGREIDILLFIAQGLTSREIGEMLFLSKRTIDYYRRRLRKKLGIKCEIELYNIAAEFAAYWNEINK